jgi:diguanylate cyclase (GGDEF)-like protein
LPRRRLVPTTLHARLLRSLAAMLVPLVVLAAAGLVAHVRSARAFDRLGEELVAQVDRVRLVGEAVDELQAAAVERDRGGASAAARLASAERLLDRRLPLLRRFDEPAELRLGRAVVRAVAAARAAEAAGSEARLQLELARAQRLLGLIAEQGLREVDEESAALHRSERRQLLAFALLLVATSLAALLIAHGTSRSLQRPLRELRRAARRLGDGDLDHRVEIEGHDELAEVAAAFNLMAERLVEGRRRLVHQAFHDDLTGLPNRALLGDRAERALACGGTRGRPLAAALFLDLDDFKGVNDSLGHEAGDELLVEVATRLHASLRPQDTIARLGGDEFAVLLEELADPEDAVRAAERILLALSPPIRVVGRELHVRASVGVAVADHGTTAEELLRNADVAMYQVKADGKCGYRTFEPWMHSEAVERLELEQELRRAIERHELELHYQPIVELGTGAVTGVEALARWLHPQRGLVAPGEFMPVAETTGLIAPLGRWIVDAACARLRLLDDAGLVDERFVTSVDVSPGQFQGEGFVDHVRATLVRHAIAPDRLVIELTETLLTADVAASTRVLADLRALGVRIALDGFGTGCSSLGHLLRLPVDVLKIDRSVVDAVAEQGGRARMAAEAIVALARTLGLPAVAEGVDDAEQRRALQALGCERGQGDLFARPLTAGGLNLFLAEPSAPGPRTPGRARR